jgi:hypothetical protein
MPHRVRRYRNNFSEMLHELKLMRDRGEIHVPSDMTESEFEEIMKKIDKHYAEDGVNIHHPLTRGRITDASSLEHLTKFFQHIYATSNNMANFRARTRNMQNRRAQAAINRMAAAEAARGARRRIEIPRAAAAAASQRTATRNAGRTAARDAAFAASVLRTARRRTPSRTTRSSRSSESRRGSRSRRGVVV